MTAQERAAKDALDVLLYGEYGDLDVLSDRELADGLISMMQEAKERDYRERTRLLRPRVRRP